MSTKGRTRRMIWIIGIALVGVSALLILDWRLRMVCEGRFGC